MIKTKIKMKILNCIIAAAALSAAASAAAQESIITPDGTYMYEKRDTCELFMDVYNPAEGSETTFMGIEKPAVIFMFGGGFIQGTRDDRSYHVLRCCTTGWMKV